MGAKAWSDALGPNTFLQTSEIYGISQRPGLAPGYKKKKKNPPPKPPETWQPRDSPTDTESSSAKHIQLLFSPFPE